MISTRKNNNSFTPRFVGLFCDTRNALTIGNYESVGRLPLLHVQNPSSPSSDNKGGVAPVVTSATTA